MRTTSFLVILAVALAGCSSAQEQQTDKLASSGSGTPQEQVIAAIQKLGGSVVTDAAAPDRPVIAVNLSFTDITDDGLSQLEELSQLRTLVLANVSKVSDAGLEHLKGLSELQSLSLENTKVDDAGLKQLDGLTQLQSLYLSGTKVTDDGLAQLDGLSQLQRLNLVGTGVSDAGLEKLSGLTQLQFLDLTDTKVTEQGLKRLQETLPKCLIYPLPNSSVANTHG
jgi:hypothetical protein